MKSAFSIALLALALAGCFAPRGETVVLRVGRFG
jgi:hypothetical protein